MRGLPERIEIKQAVPGCIACGLHKTRTQTVFGVGDENADWMLIGEAPGAEEDRLGEPFVGQAGKLLDNMLAAIGLKRTENVYIANVLKCRPPGNRNPEPEEVEKCTPFLKRQIALKYGANDFGSVMMEENVVSSAGTTFRLDAEKIEALIRDAGYEPRRRNNWYELLN